MHSGNRRPKVKLNHDHQRKVKCATLLLGIGGVLISLSKAMSP